MTCKQFFVDSFWKPAERIMQPCLSYCKLTCPKLYWQPSWMVSTSCNSLDRTLDSCSSKGMGHCLNTWQGYDRVGRGEAEEFRIKSYKGGDGKRAGPNKEVWCSRLGSNYSESEIKMAASPQWIRRGSSLRTQTYFRLSLLSPGGENLDSRKYVCVRRLARVLIWFEWGWNLFRVSSIKCEKKMHCTNVNASSL